MKFNNYKTYPLAQFNRKFVTKLKKLGYRNIRVDFDTPPPTGDFVVNPDLPIIALFSCDIRIDDPAHGRHWMKLRALDYVQRGVRLNDQFKHEGFEKDLLEAFVYCRENTLLEEQEEMEAAERDLRDLYEAPQREASMLSNSPHKT